MKKIKRLVLAFVILLLTGCSLIFKTIDYKVDTTEFKNVVAYQEEVDIAGLKIVETINGTATKIPVDKSMVTACDPTSSLGEKTLTLTYKEKTFTVKFTVKYRVNFTSGSEVLYTQYVTKASEIHAPNDPYKPGYEFDGWSPEIPNAINDNITFEAEFRDTPKEIPNLATSYDAVYGDTLKDIDLPSNAYGKWEFIDPLTTPVGNVGKNTFNVQFSPVNTELKAVKDILNVYVSKMHLDFNFTKLQFDYDGLEHTPLYTLVNTKGETVEDPAITVNYTGQKGKEVGTYFYAYTINSANYEGNAMGYFDVVANKVTITIADSSINLGDTVPNFTLVSSKEDLKPFTYLVEGVDPSTVPLLNIQISVPKINNAGEYEISASVNNENYKEVVVNKGKLTVNKLTLGATDLTITSNPVYGEKLETVTIADDNPNGYWAWVDSNVILDHAGEFEVDAVFTPYSQNYELEYRTFSLNVAKKELDITITNYEYVYDGLEKTIEYTVDGFVLGDLITDIVIDGNVKATNAGNVSTKLQVIADNYSGSESATLSIKKAVPTTDFTTVFDDVLLNKKLSDITLPEGYKWEVGSTVLKEVGEGQKFPVIYTPSDTVNYQTVYGEFTVNVIKHTAKITAKDLYEFSYNGEVFTLPNVTPSHTESELVYKYELNGQEIANIRNAGEYTVTITLPESFTYYETSITVTVVVNAIGVSPEPESKYDATYGDTLGSITLPTSEYGAWSWKEGNDALVGNAGNRTHTVVFTSNNSNYKSYEVDVTVVVAKKTLQFIINDDNIVDYDGLEHNIKYSIENDIDVEVSGNNSYISAGTYINTLIIQDDNYKGSISATLKINKIDPEVESPVLGGNGEILWNTNAFAYNSLLPEGFSFKNNFVFDTVGVDLEYVLTYTPNDTVNYNVIDKVVYFTVSKVDPTITYRESAHIYNGKEVKLNASTSNNDVDVTLEYVYRLNGEVVSAIKDAGTYSVDIISPESTNYNKAVKTVEVVVNKASATVRWNIASSYTYSVNGQTLPTAEFQDVLGNYVDLDVTFVDDNDAENKTFKKASSYVFSAVICEELAKNYTFTNTSSDLVEIKKATIDTSLASWTNEPFAYTGKEHSVVLENITWPSDVTVIYTNNKAINAGNYTAEVSFVYDSNNYNTIEVENPTYDWVIATTGLQVVWENVENHTYTGEEFTLPTAYIYDNNLETKVYLEVSMDKEKFLDAGKYEFTAIDTSGNYTLIGSKATIIVSAHILEVVWNYADSYVYNGQELTYPTATITTLEGENVTLTPEILSGEYEFKDVGKYKFFVAYLNNNYIITNENSLEVEVTKATYDMSQVKWDYSETFTFDGSKHEVKVVGLPNGVTAEYVENSATNAGTYEAEAILTYDTKNYFAIFVDNLTWTINPLEVEVTWTNNEDREYTGNQFALPSASFVDLNSNSISSNNNLLIVESNKTFKDAGEYTFTAKFSNLYEEKQNYTITNTTVVVVSKKDISNEPVAQEKLEATYGDILDDVNLPSILYGEWSFSDEHELTDLVGVTGEHIVKLDFTPYAQYESNYDALEDVEYVLVVKAYETTVIITSNGGTYNSTITDATAVVNSYVDVAAPEVTLTYTGTANDGTVVNSTAIPTKAGTYTVTATIADTNYLLGATSAIFVVSKATPGTYFNSTVLSATWSDTLASIDLSEVVKDVEGTYSFDNPTTQLTTVGNGQLFEATFTPFDTNNYEVVNSVFTVNVLGGKEASITANETYTFTYDGSEKTFVATGSHTESTLEYVYKLNGEEVSSMINAGTYSVIVTLPATEHYAVATKTVTVTINKAKVDVTWVPASGNFVYSVNGQETPKAYVNVVSGWEEINVVESNGKTFKNVGSYSFEASLTEDLAKNYELQNNIVSQTYTISKATVNLSSASWSNSTLTYNGLAQGVSVTGVTLPSDVEIKYTNNSFTNVGSYIATATLHYDSNNYNVTGSLPSDLSWSINALDATVVWENDEARNYTASELTYPTAYILDVEGNRLDLEVEMLTSGTFKNVGEYDFIAKEASGNYNLLSKDKVITVNSVELSVVWEVGTYTYEGEVLTHPRAYVVDLLGNEIDLITSIIDGHSVFMNAGDYIFEAAFGSYSDKDNYTLATTTSSLVVISKATYNMENAKWNYEDAFTYNGSAHTVEVVGLPNGVTVDSYTGNTGTDAKAYTASAVLSYDKENYEDVSIADLDWKINPKEINVTWSNESYTYTGSNLSYPTATHNEVSLSVTKTFDGLFADAGSYTFKASTTNTNYLILNPTKQYEVNKASVDLPTNLEATYGQTLSNVSLPLSEYGTWSWDNNSTSVGNVGNNSFTAVFTSTNTNYKSFEASVMVKVNAKAVIVTITPNGGTYGGTITEATASVSGYVGDVAPTVTLTYTGTANDGTTVNSTTVPTKAGTYTVTATIADTNYSLTSTSTSFVVARKDATITNNLASSSDYTGVQVDIESAFTLDHDEVDLEYSITGAGSVVKNAGTYSIVVSAAQSANYNATSLTGISYTVNKVSPELSYEGTTSYTYNSGSSYTINDSDLSNVNTDKTYSYVKVIKLNGVEVSSIHEAGTYSVTVSISETTNFNEQTINFTITVAKGTINPGDIDMSHTAIYGQKLGDFELPEANDGEWTWKEGNNTLVGNVGSNTHIAVFTPTDTSLETVEKNVTFEVSPKSITFTITSEKTFVYDGNVKSITYKLSETPVGVTVSETGTSSATVAGNYSVTYTITGNSNYTGSVVVAWSITKATPTYTTPTNLQATYKDLVSSVSLSSFDTEDGTWAWENGSVEVGNAGTQTHFAIYTPVDTDNYNTARVALSIVVAKKEYIPINNAIAATATYGDKLSGVSLEGSDSMGSWIWTTPNATVGNVGTNEISITFKLNDTNNYYVANTELVSVTVNPKDVTVTITPNGGTYAGTITGSTAKVNGYVDANAPAVTLTYTGNANDGTEVNGTSVPTKAGTYTVTATIADTNYNLKGTTTSSFIVNKATPTGSFTASSSVVYGDTLGSMNLTHSTTVDGYASWIDGEDYVPEVTTGKSYAVKFTPRDLNNYNEVTGSITVVVDRITTSIETTSGSYEFTFGDFDNFLDQLGVELSPYNNEQTIKFYNGLEEVTSISNAGDYIIAIKVEESDHYKAFSTSVTIKVNKKKEAVVMETEYEYGSTITNVEDSVQETEIGTFTISETDPEAQVAMFATRASSPLLGEANTIKYIWLTFVPNELHKNNYYEYTEKITLTIVQKQIEVVITANGGYYGNVVEASSLLNGVLVGETVDVTLTYTGTANDGTVYDSVEVPTLAGNYTVTASITAENYVLVGSVSADFIIAKAEPVVVGHTFEAHWNEKLKDHSLTNMVAKDPRTDSQVAGSFAWDNEETILSTVGDNQKFKAIFTPVDDDNYESVEYDFTVDVNKIQTTVEDTGITYFVYVKDAKVYITPTLNHTEKEAQVSITYNGNPVNFLSNAGTYKVVITVAESAHYTAYNGEEFDVVVEKATPTTDFTQVVDVVWNDNLKLKDVSYSLPGYSWDNGNIDLDNIETKSYAATYTHSDIVNYKTVSGTISVNVVKADGEVSADDSYEFVYKHAEYTVNDLSNITTNHSESTPIIDKVLLNANTYAVTITLPESTHYNAATTTTTVVIKKAVEATPSALSGTYGDKLSDLVLPGSTNGTWSLESSLNPNTILDAGTHNITLTFTANSTNYETKDYTVSVVIDKAVYTGTVVIPDGLTSTYGNTLSSVSLPTAENGTWTWKNPADLVGNAGERSHVAIFTPASDNYLTQEHNVTINVAKKTVTINVTQSSFGFNESTQYVTYTLDGVLPGDNDPTVEGNEGLRNVGSSTYELIIDDANYQGSLEVTITITKVDPEVNFEDINATGKFGSALSTVVLPAGYTFDNQAAIMNALGEQTYSATYIHPTEGDNYNVMSGTIIVTVGKGQIDMSAVKWNYETPYTYNNETKVVELINLPNGVEAVYDNNSKVNAGPYEASVVFVYDSEHYELINNNVTSLSWEIKATKVDIPLEESYQYGTTINNINLSSDYGTFGVKRNDGLSSDAILGEAGDTVSILVSFTSTNANYASFENELVEISIARAEVRFENVINEYYYDELEHTVTYTLGNVVSGETPEVRGNETLTNVGERKVTLVVDEANYYGTITVDLIIHLGTPVTDFSTVYEAEYNSKLGSITLPAGYSWKEGLSDLTLSTISNGQKYKAIYTSPNPNYKQVEGEFTVNVTKINTKVTLNSNVWTNKTYVAGDAGKYDVVASVSSGETSTITIGYNSSTTAGENADYATVTYLSNAGTYKINVYAAETATYKELNYTTYVVIYKAQSHVSFDYPIETKWSQGLTLEALKVPNNNYAWKDSSFALTDITTYNCPVVYTPADTVNYLPAEGTFAVTVNKADASVSATLKSQDSIYYRENGYTVEELFNITKSHSESDLVYTYLLGGESVSGILNAGTYDITITLPESTHYNVSSCDVTVTINKLKVDLPTGLTATYGDTLGSVSLPTSTYGVWTWDAGNGTSVGNAGSKEFAVTFTPYDSYKNNYAEVKDNVTVVVNRQITTIDANIPSELVYNNNSFGYASWFVTNSDGQVSFVIKKDGVSVVANKNTVKDAGAYTIEVTVAESDNFTEKKYECSFNVKQAEYTGTITKPEGLTATYGDYLCDVLLSSYNVAGDNGGEWSWIIENGENPTVGNAGTNSFYAKFTPNDPNYIDSSSHKIEIKVNKKKLTISVVDAVDNKVSKPYTGATQYIIYELKDGDTVIYTNADGAKPSINVVQTLDGEGINVGLYGYSLVIDDSNYYSDVVEGVVEVTQAEVKITLPTYTGQTFYEDRLPDIDLAGRGTALNRATNKLVEGKFSYDQPEFLTGTATSRVVNIEVTFTPDDPVNYQGDTGNIQITLLPVAYIGSTYYGTVEKALAAATSGKTVYVIVGTDPIIRENAEIISGVTLFLPHTTGVTKNYTTAQCPYHGHTSECGKSLFDQIGGLLGGSGGGKVCGNAMYVTFTDKLTLTMTINNNVTLINNGTLEISGNLSGGGGGSDAVGHTVGNYAQIVLKDNAKIESYDENSVLNVFGYIKAEKENNGSHVLMDNGNLGMPFIVRDFKGGSQTKALYDKFGASPGSAAAFDQYELRNIQTKLRMNYNSTLDGWANIYAGNQHNGTIVKLVGNTKEYMIQFTTTESYLESTGQFVTATNKYFDGNDGLWKEEKRTYYALDINLYGGAKTNTMKLDIKVLTTMEVSTANVYFALNNATSINLYPAPGQQTASYSMEQKFKMLPGSRLNIAEGVTLTVGSLFVYDDFERSFDGITNAMARYYPIDCEPAELIVSGALNATNLAGNVLVEKGKGIVNVSGSTTMTMYDAKQTNGGSTMDCEMPADNGWFITTSSLTKKDFIKINKVIDEEITSEEHLLSEGNYVPEATSKDGYRFDGWYIGDELYTVAFPNGIDESVILTARFTLLTYDIDYNLYNYTNGSSGTNEAEVTYNETLDSFTVEDGLINFGVPAHSEGHTLKGLYINSTSGEPIPVVTVDEERVYGIEAQELFKYLKDNTIAVYAVWYQNPLTIEFVNNNFDQKVLDLFHWSIEHTNTGGTVNIPSTLYSVNSYVFPDLSTYNDDETYKKYFVGWKCNGQIINNFSFTQEQINEIMNSSKIVELEAVWEDKIEVTLKVGEGAPVAYTINGGRYNQTLYLHISQINSYTFYEDIGFYTSWTDTNQESYFDAWYCNEEKLSSNTLNINLINLNSIIIQGKWYEKSIIVYEKQVVDLNVSLGLTSSAETKMFYYIPGYEVDLLYAPAEKGHTLLWQNSNGNKYNPSDINSYTFDVNTYGTCVTLTSVYTPKTFNISISGSGNQKVTVKNGNTSLVSNSSSPSYSGKVTYGDNLNISYGTASVGFLTQKQTTAKVTMNGTTVSFENSIISSVNENVVVGETDVTIVFSKT